MGELLLHTAAHERGTLVLYYICEVFCIEKSEPVLCSIGVFGVVAALASGIHLKKPLLQRETCNFMYLGCCHLCGIRRHLLIRAQ